MLKTGNILSPPPPPPFREQVTDNKIFVRNKSLLPKNNTFKIGSLLIVLCFLLLPVGLFAQNVISLDVALREAANYFNEMLPNGSTIAVLDFEPGDSREAIFIVEELTQIMVNDRVFTLVDRGRLAALIEREKALHMDGRISDASAVGIGHELGAHTIITGTVTSVDGAFRIRMQSINVLSGSITGVWTKTASLADDGWKRKPVYLGAAFGFGIPSFSDAAEGFLPGYAARDFSGLNSIEAEFRFSYAFSENLGLQTGVIIGADSFEIFNPRTNSYLTSITYQTITLPLMVKGMYHPQIFRLQGYGGLYVSFPLGQMEISDGKNTVNADFTTTVGFVAGIGAGIKLGPGILMLDGRFLTDLSDVSVKYNGINEFTEIPLGKRQKLSFWLGYEFGF